MSLRYDILVPGNSLKLAEGFLGISTITLVAAPDGPMLVDVGGYVTRTALLNALGRRGLAPKDIRRVLLTHLHFDHAHNIDLFPEAEILVSQAEWAYAAAPHPEDLLLPWGVRERISAQRHVLLEGETDLALGLRVFPAPGHTPGCQALALEHPEHGTVVIAGDAIKYAREAIEARCDLAFDRLEVGSATIERILGMAERIVPGHHPELIRTARGFTWRETSELSLIVR